MNSNLIKIALVFNLIMGQHLSAATIYEEFQLMKQDVKRLSKELKEVKAEKAVEVAEEESKNLNIDFTEEIEELKEEVSDLSEEIVELNKQSSGDNLKFSVDFRSSYENIQYKMADGSEQKNDGLLINRLWLNMNFKANENISFSGQLAYYKAFGARALGQPDPNQTNDTNPGAFFETFDWITNENAYDDNVRVRSAYFFYRDDQFLSLDIPWTFSIGRRPSVGGHFINYREDDPAASPSGHAINVELDGLSSKFSLQNIFNVEGMYVKFCAGRGFSNAAPRFNPAPFASRDEDTDDIDLAGVIFVPYDDGQYQVLSEFYYANNLIDFDTTSALEGRSGFSTVGGLGSASLAFSINGIGDEWNDYLDSTTFFLSTAMSQTDPKGEGMLGSTDKEEGYSYWLGLNMPSLISDEGAWGIEYNHGSKYWRSITYAEDTNIGSKVAARGDAYEIYFTEPIVDDILSLQLRITYIDYKYTGSNGFFGNSTGTPILIDDITTVEGGANVVDTASDVRFYIRYKY